MIQYTKGYNNDTIGVIYIKARKALAIVFTLLTLAWCFVIWSFSIKDSEKSDAQSNKVVEIVNDTIERVSGAKVDASNRLVRKSAHFLEFALLGALIFVTLCLFKVRSLIKNYAIGLSISVVTATIDELLQLTSPGRSSQLTDVLLDTTGALVAFTACALIMRALYALRHKRAR